MNKTAEHSVRDAWRAWHLWLVILAALSGACGDKRAGPSVGSNSNWLTLCDRDAECGTETACRCGACAQECARDSDCGDLAEAHCALSSAPATASACFEDTPTGMCLPRCDPGGCPQQMPCVAGACVPISLPTSEFCDPEADRDPEERALEDELLVELATLRAAGGVTCGDNPESIAAPTLGVDARLWCAARALARDMEQTGEPSLTDSLGRNTDERLQLAGYASVRWGETFALASNAATSLQGMLSSESACLQLTAVDLVNVGVGVSGNVAVITLASP